MENKSQDRPDKDKNNLYFEDCLRMNPDFQLRRIAGVGDLYTIDLDNVDTLCLERSLQAQEDKEE